MNYYRRSITRCWEDILLYIAHGIPRLWLVGTRYHGYLQVGSNYKCLITNKTREKPVLYFKKNNQKPSRYLHIVCVFDESVQNYIFLHTLQDSQIAITSFNQNLNIRKKWIFLIFSDVASVFKSLTWASSHSHAQRLKFFRRIASNGPHESIFFRLHLRSPHDWNSYQKHQITFIN